MSTARGIGDSSLLAKLLQRSGQDQWGVLITCVATAATSARAIGVGIPS